MSSDTPSPERNQAVPMDTEKKSWWLSYGESLEQAFVGICTQKLNINAEINPAKSEDPTAPDLLFEGRIADLKVQNTPFFSAQTYGMDPRFTVTFNRKDYERYLNNYPDIGVIFWVNWTQLSWKNYSVEPFNQVYAASIQKIRSFVESGAAEHSYIHRQNDELGNAKSSFLFDVRKMKLVAVIKEEPTVL